MCGMFQKQFSNKKVTIKSFCDETEAGISSSFNHYMQGDFYWTRADFYDINDYAAVATSSETK